jgi:RimJ/RimL family protein N-acetyltransferase
MYIIESRTTGEKIGQVGLYAWDEEKREAELGRLMAAPSGVPTGQIAQGTIAICDWGFRHLSLKRIYCEIFSDNAASLRVARVAGLKQIGQTGKLVLYDLDPSVGLRPDSTFDTNHRPV